ncbi:MarR family winged helix-turn-helix transcriptional regulator [Glycomyces mayteni]|uniref:MarR family winged helix-turn-helix transcriptional regulator n=1 Tax=Glycomyces mayteni TaxID=543887 RepID=A0ABW2D8L3_9ACTN|nr:MarR family winged helix-turn-helix transcriptional regulator [Glycomyces mayteni]
MSDSSIDEILNDCLAVRIRLIGRAVTGLYDSALGGHEVTIAQVNLLAALGKVGPCSPSRLGEVLQLERSTVSRNVNLMLGHGWIEAVSSDAKGVREVALSRAGRAKIESVMPHWRRAQRQAAELLGATGAGAVRAMAGDLGYPPGA